MSAAWSAQVLDLKQRRARGWMRRRVALFDLDRREAGKVLAQPLLDALSQRDRRRRAARAGAGEPQAHHALADVQYLDGATMRMDVRPDRLECRLGDTPLVDADPVGVQEPGNGRIGGADTGDVGGAEQRPQAAQCHAVEAVDSVEQLEHRDAHGVVERFNLLDELLEPLEQLIESPHENKGTPQARRAGSPARIVVGCVGNVLRRDDGFGPAVAARLERLPAGVDLVESGIGGIALLQELMAGSDGLVVVDAVDRGAKPGTVFVVEPEVAPYDNVPDMHLATPERVLSMARELRCLPERVVIVGCQPADAEGMGTELSPAVAGAVDAAAAQVRATVAAWLAETSSEGTPER